jgi:protein-disulfide isomerase
VVKKARRNNTPFYAFLAILAVVGIGALAYVASQPRGEAAVTIDPNTPLPRPEGYLLGKADAPVKVIEFADFECPACAQFFAVTEPDVRKRLVDQGTISYQFFDYPLPMHPNTWPASNAAACAAEQGKFWEMHDQLFNGQDRWNGIATRRPKGIFKDYASAVGVNVDQWEQCYDAKKFQSRIEANRREAERQKVPSTPTFFIGNKMVVGAIGYDEFKAYVDSALAAAPAAKAADSALSKSVARDTGASRK